MLYIVAIALCPIDYAYECNRTMSPDFRTFWFYRPNLEACERYGRQMLEQLDFDAATHQARIYCVRAETFDNAESFDVP